MVLEFWLRPFSSLTKVSLVWLHEVEMHLFYNFTINELYRFKPVNARYLSCEVWLGWV